jgi:hypothetical protein
VLRELLVNKVLQELLDLLEIQEKLVQRELLDQRGLEEGQQAHQEKQVRQVRQVLKVFQGKQELQVPLV